MQNSYRRDIQALRGLAVICVVINHISKSALPNGFLGVDIFFVLSGYVVTPLMLEIFEQHSTHKTLQQTLARGGGGGLEINSILQN